MTQQAPVQAAQPPGGSGLAVPVLAVAVVIVLFLAGLMIVLVAGPSGSSLEADLDSEIVGALGFVAVTVYGDVSNTGDEALYGTVTIRVWDGSGWQTFTQDTGLIQPGDSTPFYWGNVFEGSDQSEFEVEWSISEEGV